MDKKKITIISVSVVGVLVFVVLLIIFLNLSAKNAKYKETDAYKFKNEYEELNNEVVTGSKTYPKVEIPKNNMIKYSTVDDILNIFNNMEDGVVYFGYSTCLYCRNAIQVLLDVASSTELDVMHYIDIEDVWDVKKLDPNNKVVTEKEASDKYYQLLDVLGDELVSDYVLTDNNGNEVNTGEKRLEVPLVIFITNGKVSSYNKGTLFSQTDPLVEMDKYQIEGLSEIYRYGIRDVVDSKKNKGLL